MGHLLVSGSFCVLLKPKHVGMALYEPLYLCVCVSQLRSPSLLNSERPWGRPHPGVGRGEGGGVGELHYLLISTSVPLWQSQASVLPPVSWRVSSDRELSWGLAASTIWPGWCWGRWGNLSQDAPLGPQA